MVIIVLDEAADLGFEITLYIVILQQGPVLQNLMPFFFLPLDLALV